MDVPLTVFNSSVANIMISDLLPYHIYSITVTAITVDNGPESHPVSFQTLEDGEMLETSYVVLKAHIMHCTL